MQPPSFVGQHERYQGIELNPDTGLWLARGVQSGRLVSVRVVTASEGYRPERVFREAKTLGEIQSSHIAKIIDFGQNPSRGDYYIIMDALVGITLERKVQMTQFNRLPQFEAISIFAQLIDALRLVHERSVIHRNIRPRAIVISPDQQVTLWDFGLVQTASSIQQGMLELLMSHAYMAPELVAGDMAVPQSDIYSVGAVLYFMLTGHPPFEAGDWITLAKKITHSEPVQLRWYRTDVIEPIETLLTRCMYKRPSQRFQSAADVLDWLKAERLNIHRDVKSYRLSQISKALEHDQLEKARDELKVLQRQYPKDRDVSRVARLVWQRWRTRKRTELEKHYALLIKYRKDRAYNKVIQSLKSMEAVMDEIKRENLEDERYLRNWHEKLEEIRREILIAQGVSFLSSSTTNRIYPMEKDVNFVGRRSKRGPSQIDVDLSAEPDFRTVSRQHAKIVRDGITWRIIHLSTVSITKVGGELVGPEGALLTDGAVVQLGKVQLSFHIRRNTSVHLEEEV